VTYATANGLLKVTISVDRYKRADDAALAYADAVQKSQSAPAFKLLPSSNVGEQSFVGTATDGSETNIGLGARDGNLILGVTLAGSDALPEEQAKLVALSVAEDAVAKAALGIAEH
jgi:hypothetical protein